MELIKALIPRIEACHETLSALQVGSTMYGLKGMKSNHPVVTQLLKVIIQKINSCVEPLNRQYIAMSIGGLKI